VYQQALELELANRAIPFGVNREIRISYKGCLIERMYVPDLAVYENLIVSS
jgi:GxxExxY protein